ncbi:lipoyl synthase [Desulfogranum marinum]|uniref:lipoyl synthase n=1 Tax=Desulfogranum marinum TaxID=453220 RepID=UPI0029C7A1B6|nr:lipoyl synthase [Desulfogranum marinum]
MEEIKKSGKPPWLRRKLPSGPNYEKIRQLVKKNHLATVCQEAMCPNQFECYGKGTATFMILGDHCTRNCRFCAVQHGALGPPENDEPTRVAQAVKTMELRYAVITSVTRDDMPDGGAHHFAQTIEAIRELSPDTLIEVLIPDLQGNWDALDAIIEAKPDVLNHNLETIKRLYPTVRPQAVYHRSLELLRKVKEKQVTMITKSGMMVGLGETIEELQTAFTDLADARCDILTLGQYLQPSKDHLAVEHYLSPEKFELLKQQALHLGFAGVAAAPFVRSSYQAEELYTLAAKKPAAAS